MSTCQITIEMREDVRSKLLEIRRQVNSIIESVDGEESCLLCEIRVVIESAYELEKLVSLYHFRSSLLPHVEGLDSIIKALSALASKNHGALVAIERSDSLEKYISPVSGTGVFLGASLSSALLQSIFCPGSPLHDGATILRREQIMAAGCVLPLSERKYTEEGKKIGTRHRAAIGLSEKTDALVLIVSEETGVVSYALGGQLHPIEIKLCSQNKYEVSPS